MKKLLSVTSLILVLVMIIGVFCSCSQGGTKTDETDKSVKIGIAAPEVTHGWVAGVAYYAEKYCRNNNIDYKITTSADAADMAANLNDLITWGADAIVMWPQWTGMEDSVDEIIAQGIPVVSFDFDIACDGIYKVAGNNFDMGYQSAKYIAEKVGDGATVAVLDVPSAGSVSALRKQGFYDYLKEIGYDQSNIFEVGLEGFTRDSGLKVMTDVLESRKKIDAVFSIDDEISIGAVQAITEAGRNDIKAITGGGGMQEYFKMIKNEKYASLGLSSALYSPSMVEDAVKSAILLVNGGTCEKEIIIPTTIVTSQNVDEFIDEGNTVY